MVSYRSVTVTLVSIPEVKAIPEYTPPNDPTVPSRSELADPFVDDDVPETPATAHFSSASAVFDKCSSTIPVLALLPPVGSDQFWVHYQVAPPYPPKAQYFFKLFVNGRPFISWGVGHKEGFRGSIWFAPAEDGQANTFHFAEAKSIGQTKEDLTESSPQSPGSTFSQATIVPSAAITVKVFRARGRESCSLPDSEHLPHPPFEPGSSVYFVPSTRLPGRHPHRYYRYSLIDPVDAPFATFQYFLKTKDDLTKLGIDLSAPTNDRSRPSTPSTLSLTSLSASDSDTSAHSVYDQSSARSSYDGSGFDVSLMQEYGQSSALGEGFSATRTWRPLSSISEAEDESPDTTPRQRRLGMTYKPSVKNLRSAAQPIVDGEAEEPSTPVQGPAPSWPLDNSRRLPDLPEDEVIPRPRGGQGSSHTLLVTRFPKFASSSTITSTSSLRSMVSDTLSDPFVMPDSPVGRGDPLPLLQLTGGLRSHPTNHLRERSWDSKSSSLMIPGTTIPQSRSRITYASSSLGGGLQRSDSVVSIGRAVSRPGNQRPPTPNAETLEQIADAESTSDTEYVPRLGTPPVFFSQQVCAMKPASENQDQTVIGFNTAEAVLPKRPSSSPPEHTGLPRLFPARKSSLTGVRPTISGLRKVLSGSSAESSASAPADLGSKPHVPSKLIRQHTPSPLSFEDPRTPPNRMRANLAKFFGAEVYADSEALASTVRTGTPKSEKLKRKGSLFAIGKDVWESVKKANAKSKEQLREMRELDRKEEMMHLNGGALMFARMGGRI